MSKPRKPPFIAGLYQYCRAGRCRPPTKTLEEITLSLRANPGYSDMLTVLSGNHHCTAALSQLGLKVTKTFEDAPAFVKANSAHLMKHWMCIWALREYGEFIWVDWDTLMTREPQDDFYDYCREHQTPKFIRIKHYWATVNCGVYYAPHTWLDQMTAGLEANLSEPNDELCWATVLPKNVVSDSRFWWGDRVINVWNKEDMKAVPAAACFLHVRDLRWANHLGSPQKKNGGCNYS
jgi:hypothetical protein